jgi:hypothetical protein
MLQVELRLLSSSGGMRPAHVTVQVEVERVSPATLLLRAIGGTNR